VNIEPFPIPTPDEERFPGDSDGAIKSELRAPAKIMAIFGRAGVREGAGVKPVDILPRRGHWHPALALRCAERRERATPDRC
jgi:hypothetical protein